VHQLLQFSGFPSYFAQKVWIIVQDLQVPYQPQQFHPVVQFHFDHPTL
jgi:hypothetical protein